MEHRHDPFIHVVRDADAIAGIGEHGIIPVIIGTDSDQMGDVDRILITDNELVLHSLTSISERASLLLRFLWEPRALPRLLPSLRQD